MNRSRIAPPLAAVAALASLVLVVAACTSTTSTSQTPEPTPTQTAEATATETAEPTASAEPSESAEASLDESAEPSGSPIGGEPGGFTFASNAEADELFLSRFSCQNLDAGFEVDFPAEWNANAEHGDVPQCSWFAPTEYEADDLPNVPDEVAIVMTIDDGTLVDAAADGDVSDRAEGFIGVTQPAYRVTVEDGDDTGYYYVVQLGRSFEEGPNLVAYTTDEMGEDFDLNRAVLDRMMATMEFIGVIQ